ncbi:HAMP domain-containing sensor histidine kinase [Actinomadura sp. KC345]|uniref:sensor histidine kinase n=1 Tax=Actinomadura sp. KC345 TaxID=2530371 RepID=UPI001FB7EDB0|nr:HAMP domain-containing sensor histidine kinase [Actinomadura sp. KC345]
MTLAAALVTLLLSAVLCAVLLNLVRQQAVHDTVESQAREGRRVTTALRAGPLEKVIHQPGDALQQVVDAKGNVIAASPEMWGRPPLRLSPPNEFDSRRDIRTCSIDAPGGDCFLVVEVRVGFGADAHYVFSLTPEPGLFPRPLTASLLILGVPVVTALASWGMWTAASRALRPVDAIRRELDEITATDLERRVPQPPRRDEVGLLAESINATLDRLEQAVARQRGFVSDVSHELRSPLAALRMELELALAAPEEADMAETLRAILDNTDRLSAVVDDLLALGRLEADPNFRREPVDLTGLADQEVLSRPRRTQVTVLSEGSVTVQGGRVELARLLTNLIDNADRHAAHEVTVILRVEPPSTAVVEVVDDGTGIAPEDRERVFERFTRLSQGGHRDAGGTGLGLAISRDIAQAHRGSLVLTDRSDGIPGARFVLRLPQ